MSLAVELGIIEGYFGRPWPWAARTAVMRRLAGSGYRFFCYAPKAEPKLRRRWREPFDDVELQPLLAFSAACRASGMRFGVGLSPFEAWRDEDWLEPLTAKIAQLDALGLDDLAILFDDMDGDLADLAERQTRIVDAAAGLTSATRLIVCPSYYSDDPVLDRVFGPRPERYLERLGELLDPKVEVFWTGEEVCSREILPGHLDAVAEALKRKPVLWDNYPVNDGPRMSRHLHLRAFTGRPARIAAHISAHAINPALQPTLSCIPALTLAASYAAGDAYRYGAATDDAARDVAGEALGRMLVADLLTFQDSGLDLIDEARKARLRARYEPFDHPAAREVVEWLDGKAFVSAEEVKTQ